MFRMASLEQLNGVDRIARPLAPFEIADPDRSATRRLLGRGEASVKRSHVAGVFLERIAGRDQPPHLVEPERAPGGKAHSPMPAMGRVERAAEETDARHGKS